MQLSRSLAIAAPMSFDRSRCLRGGLPLTVSSSACYFIHAGQSSGFSWKTFRQGRILQTSRRTSDKTIEISACWSLGMKILNNRMDDKTLH